MFSFLCTKCVMVRSTYPHWGSFTSRRGAAGLMEINGTFHSQHKTDTDPVIQALWAVFPFWEVKALSVCGPCPQAQRLSDSVLTECYNSTLISQHIPTYIFCMKQKHDETIFSLVLCDTLSVFKLFLFLHKELMNALPTPTAQVTSGSVMTCGRENSIFCFILSVLLNLKIFCEKPEHVKLKMILF